MKIILIFYIWVDFWFEIGFIGLINDLDINKYKSLKLYIKFTIDSYW